MNRDILSIIVLAAAAFTAPRPLIAQGAQPPSNGHLGPTPALDAERRTGPVDIDGRLNEAAWAAAPVGSDFMQSWPQPNAEPTERTEVRVLYDDDALYVGVRLRDDQPDSVAAQLARRDASGIYSDWVHVIIDSYHDRRTAFRFSANPLGVKKDVYTSNDGDEDVSWDAVWDVATRVDSLGWTAEYRIPFSQLRFGSQPSDSGRVWGFQVMRDIARHDERDSWSPWTRRSPGFVSAFGNLTGLDGIHPPHRFELQPYTSARLVRAPGSSANPFFEPTDASFSVGADVKYGLPAGLTLTATVNPDFGQVEVDPAVVNLSAFETFFPEKRPFFVEGSDIFSFGNTQSFNNYNRYIYFYSRRIGRPPQRGLSGSQYAYVDAPDQTTIATAAKVSGKTASGWSIGFLDAVTTPEEARYADPTGDMRTTRVEPLTNYMVARLRKDLRQGRSVLGGIFTATNRDLSLPALAGLLRSGAYIGGADFLHTWANRAWSVSGYVAGSRIRGEPDVIAAAQASSARYYQRPDADYLEIDPTRTALDGHIAELALAKAGGRHWTGSLSYRDVSPGFELNDIGFLSRADARAFSTFLRYVEDRASGWYRNYSAYVYTNQAWNYGGDLIYDGFAGSGNVQLSSFHTIGASFTYNPRTMSDRLTRGGPLARSPSQWYGSAYFSSDARKPIVAQVFGSLSRDELGGNSREISISLDARPATNVHVSFGPDLQKQTTYQQYVRTVADPSADATSGRRYVFARLRQTTLGLDTRLDWTFTPTLSLQLYAQPFVSAGRYSSFRELDAPASLDYAIYGVDRGTIVRGVQGRQGFYTVDPDADGPAPAFQFFDPDFTFRSLRGNAVLRWEYRPGSTLYLVWQQQRSYSLPDGTFELGRDTRGIFDSVPTNIFLLKLSYWIGN